MDGEGIRAAGARSGAAHAKVVIMGADDHIFIPEEGIAPRQQGDDVMGAAHLMHHLRAGVDCAGEGHAGGRQGGIELLLQAGKGNAAASEDAVGEAAADMKKGDAEAAEALVGVKPGQ
ncbi:MAG: hypothetical protein BWY77_01215 [bacterium ADurb.Bin431]|nr:MAG: hypothetical protein BWY77_01215 [bacterium ADurb.Bin431]